MFEIKYNAGQALHFQESDGENRLCSIYNILEIKHDYVKM